MKPRRTVVSSEVRQNWRDVLAHVVAGGEVVVVHYNRPVAIISPYQEAEMTGPRPGVPVAENMRRFDSQTLADMILRDLRELPDANEYEIRTMLGIVRSRSRRDLGELAPEFVDRLAAKVDAYFEKA